MKKLFALSISLGLSAVSFDGMAEARLVDMSSEESPYQIQLSTAVNKANRQDYYGNASAFIPLLQNHDWVLFSEIGQQQSFYKGSVSSVDIGLRWLTPSGEHLLGVHGGYDYQISTENNAFQIASVGAEWRSERWHVYGNAYLPITKRVIEANYHQWRLEPDPTNVGFHNVYQVQGQEKALSGYEGNVAYQFWQRFNASVAVGAYRYSATDVKTIKGTQATLQFDVFNAFRDGGKAHFLNQISIESGFQHDNIYKTNWYSGVKFVFNLGKAQRLTGLQPYMQYGVERYKGTLLRPNDNVPLTLFTNADGTALTIAQVSNQTQLSSAIDNNADVIAIHGAINDVETLVLKPGQVLTGGDYTLSNGVNVQAGSGGALSAQTDQDLIRVSQNNRIENIALSVGGYNSAITNLANSRVVTGVTGSGIGNLTIDNVTIATAEKAQGVSSTMAAVYVFINDASQDSSLTVTNSQFSFGAANNNTGVYANVQNGALQTSITNNTMTFASGSTNMEGILLQTFARNGDSLITASDLSHNTFTFANGSSNSGVAVFASRNDTSSDYNSQVNITNLHNNKVVMGSGNSNNGFKFQVGASTQQNNSINVDSFIANTASFAGGNNVAGVNTQTLTGVGSVVLRNVINNLFTLPDGSNNYGFNLLASEFGASYITVHVGNNGVGLGPSNHGASVNLGSSEYVKVYP